MFTAIIAQLKTLITAVAGVQLVYDYEPNKPTKYPFVSITPLGHAKSEYASLRDATREVRIMLRVYGHLHDTQKTGQTNLRTVVDSIINTLEHKDNVTLSGTINYSELSESNFHFVNKESQLYVCEIIYHAQVRYNRFS
jgi:hypothetical protein